MEDAGAMKERGLMRAPVVARTLSPVVCWCPKQGAREVAVFDFSDADVVPIDVRRRDVFMTRVIRQKTRPLVS